jgi:hypothetical protein
MSVVRLSGVILAAHLLNMWGLSVGFVCHYTL